ncbi:MAG: TolC family outer membrane protein [Hyphomicrobiaceae bacterium]
MQGRSTTGTRAMVTSVAKHLLRYTGLVLAAGLVAGPVSASAETLGEALASAYASNPRINAERARLRATDEELAKAQSGYRPTLFGTADWFMYQRTETEPRGLASQNDGILNPKVITLNAQQQLYSGGRIVNTVRQADAVILASREQLRGVEQQLFLDGVTAYVNVIRDQEIFRLRQSNVEVLSQELKATEERFAVGEVTKTDVAQARARRAASVSALDLSKANLRSSIADYERVTGHPPTALEEPSARTDLIPAGVEEAIRIGESEHPDVIAAAFFERAAGFAIKTIEGELLPDLRLEATYTDRIDPTRTVDRQEQGAIVARLTVPFYQGGEVQARIRQAKEERVGRLEDIEQARVQVRAQVSSAWSQYVAAQAQIESDRVQVEAAQIALDGVREEEKVGQRTLLDVLDAEQERLNARVQLVTTERNLIVASYSLLASMGRLTATDLSLPTPKYDVEQNYDEVNGKWWGTTIEREEGYEGSTESTDWQASIAETDDDTRGNSDSHSGGTP